MRRGFLGLAISGVLLAAAPAHALTATPVGNFDSPMIVTAPPGDAHREFVVERYGKVKIVRDGVVLPTPFLDLSGADLLHNGVTSMAFAPDYAESGHVYVLYEISAHNPDNAQGVRVELDEFTRGSDPDQVDATTRRNLL